MANAKITSIVTEHITDTINESNLELVDVVYEKEGPNFFLRIFIDKEGGVTIDDCEDTSRKISKILDEIDPIKTAYILEVSSPGIERVLKKDSDFVKFSGHQVEVRLYKAIEKNKSIIGILDILEEDVLTIEKDGQKLSIERSNIAQVKLKVDF